MNNTKAEKMFKKLGYKKEFNNYDDRISIIYKKHPLNFLDEIDTSRYKYIEFSYDKETKEITFKTYERFVDLDYTGWNYNIANITSINEKELQAIDYQCSELVWIMNIVENFYLKGMKK